MCYIVPQAKMSTPCTWSSRSKPGALGYLDVRDETLDVADSEHKLLLGKDLGLLMDPTGDNKLSLPELGVTVELLEHETWEREVHMVLKMMIKIDK